MLFFTLFSGSIIYFLTPKVSVSNIQSGTLTEKRTFNDIKITYSTLENIHIPYSISNGLHIEHVFKKSGDVIHLGEPLIQFNTVDYNIYLSELINKISLVKTKYNNSLKKKQYIEDIYTLGINELNSRTANLLPPSQGNSALQEIQNEIDTKKALYNSSLKQYKLSEDLYNIGGISKQELDAISESITNLEKEIDFLNLKYENTFSNLKREYDEAINTINQEKNNLLLDKISSLANLTEVDELNSEYKLLENQYNILNSMIKDDQLIAPCDGIIYTSNFEEGTSYTGYDTILEIAPLDANVNYTIDVSNENKIFLNNIKSGLLQLQNESVPIDVIKINEHTTAEDEQIKTLTFKPVNSLSKEQQSQIKFLTLESESDYYNTIVPINAIIDDNYVFILTEEDHGIWGTYYYAQKTAVKTDAYNTSDIGIINGLSPNQRIIVSWDRALNDKQRVILELS